MYKRPDALQADWNKPIKTRKKKLTNQIPSYTQTKYVFDCIRYFGHKTAASIATSAMTMHFSSRLCDAHIF